VVVTWNHAAVLAASASLLAACGGGAKNSQGVATLPTTGTGTAASSTQSVATGSAMSQALAYARCMRAHGEPKYPDPTLGPDGQPAEHLGSQTSPGLDPSSRQFKSAERACLARQRSASTSLQQSIATNQRQELRFAACMRTHGEPAFPDPIMLRYGIELQLPPHIDPNSPPFQRAQRTCTKLGDGPANF
jgi:hypothetical protein